MNPEDGELGRARLLDRICRDFEVAWRSGARPAIEPFLSRWPEVDASDLLVELVAIDAERRRQLGEPAAADDYAGRFPDCRGRIEAVFAELPEPTGPWRQLGPYRLVREIGRGGRGVVYEAVHEKLQRRVAVKVLSRPSSRDQLRRF